MDIHTTPASVVLHAVKLHHLLVSDLSAAVET